MLLQEVSPPNHVNAQFRGCAAALLDQVSHSVALEVVVKLWLSIFKEVLFLFTIEV